MALRLITPPASDPISLVEAKAHLRVDHSDDDTIIVAMITAAVRHAEKFTGRAFIDQTWELVMDGFPTNEIEIPKPPLIEIVSVLYDDTAGNEQTLSASSYVVDNVSEPGWVLPSSSSWLSTFSSINAVRIQYRAGYLDNNSPRGENVPEEIKQAIKLEVGTFYQQRETIVLGQTIVELNRAWEWLLRPYRVERGMA